MKLTLVLVASFLTSNQLLAQVESVKALDSLPVQTTSVSMSDSEAHRSPFGLSFFSIGGIDRAQLSDGQGTQSMYFFEDYLALSYKISKNFKMSARYSFNYSTSGTDKFGKEVTDKLDTRDMSLLLTLTNLFEDQLPSNISYKLQPRLYLPTSEGSKNQGLITSLRLENEVKIYVGKYDSLRLWINPQYYFQRTTVFLDDKGKPKTTDMFASKHGAEFIYDLGRTFSLKPGFEMEDGWTNASPANNKDEFRKTNIDYRLGLGINVSKPLSFTVGYSHKKDLIKTDDYADGFTLMTVATIY